MRERFGNHFFLAANRGDFAFCKFGGPVAQGAPIEYFFLFHFFLLMVPDKAGLFNFCIKYTH